MAGTVLNISNPIYQSQQSGNPPKTATTNRGTLPRGYTDYSIPDRNGTTVANFLGISNPIRTPQASGGGSRPSTPPAVKPGLTFDGKPNYNNPGATYYKTPSKSGSGTGTGSSSTYVKPYVDPVVTERLRQQSIWLNSLPGAVGNIRENASTAFSDAKRSYQGGAESLYNTVSQGQKGINTSRENVELTRLNGIKDILDYVRQGMTSAGRAVSARNASDSSAMEQFAKGFGEQSETMNRGVNSDAFLQGRDIDTQQDGLNLTKTQGRKDLERQADQFISTILNSTRQDLYQLDMEGQKLGLKGKVAIDAEKKRVQAEGEKKLAAVESWLTSQFGKISIPNAATTTKNAYNLSLGGNQNAVLDYGAYTGMSQPPAGPPLSQMPLFTRNR